MAPCLFLPTTAQAGRASIPSGRTVSGSNLFAAINVFGILPAGLVFLSTNNGASWTPVNTGLTRGIIVYSLVVSGSNLFAGTSGGVFVSTNNGTSWMAANNGLTNTDVHSLAVSGPHLFAGTDDGGVWRRPLSEMVTGVGR
jgi:hypothetical protein